MRVAIQGELGSNSHMATMAMLEDDGALEVVPCTLSAQVFERVIAGEVDAAVLPIENSLHGSVAEHYDLLLESSVRIEAESMLRIRHNLIVMPGVQPNEVKKLLSHAVALSQCRRFLAAHPEYEAVPFYDTAGSVKHLMASQQREIAGIAPALAARQYGAEVLIAGVEDHAMNYTRFHLLRRGKAELESAEGAWDKMSLAFSLDHRPGTLVATLQRLSEAGGNLSKIESRPVPGAPWEYIFYVDVRFEDRSHAGEAVDELRRHCRMVKLLGCYASASTEEQKVELMASSIE